MPGRNDDFAALPPQSLDMEQAVLGAMLIERAAIETAAAILRPDDFYREVHGLVFRAVVALAERGRDVDLLTVQEELRDMEYLDLVGAPYLVQLVNAVPAAAHVEHYARTVEEQSIRRALIRSGGEIVRLGYAPCNEIAELIDLARGSIDVVGDRRLSTASTLDGEVGAGALPAAKAVQEIWFGLYPGRAHLVIGETGAGKSSLLYNFAIHAARNEPLWNVRFGPGRPLRVYYVDPENAGDFRSQEQDGGLCRRKIDRILRVDETGEVCPPTLVFYDGRGLNLSVESHVRMLERRLRRGIDEQPFDVLILEPMLSLFGLQDENDNAELGRISQLVRDLSRRTGACVILVHHTGKSALLSGVHSGRGGSALADQMDVVFTFRARGPGEDEEDEDYTGTARERHDVCRLRIEKDRPAMFGKDVSLYLRMAGNDRFERVGFAEWKEAGRHDELGAKARDALDRIPALLADGEWQARAKLIDTLREEGIGRINADAALNVLKRKQTIEATHMGGAALYYRLCPPAPPTDTTISADPPVLEGKDDPFLDEADIPTEPTDT